MNKTILLPVASSRREEIRTRLPWLHPFFALTDKEFNVLATLIELDSSNPTASRQRAAEKLTMSVAVFNNLLKALVKKNALTRQSRSYKYCPLITEVISSTSLTIRFDGAPTQK